jgi:hypothetical protein
MAIYGPQFGSRNDKDIVKHDGNVHAIRKKRLFTNTTPHSRGYEPKRRVRPVRWQIKGCQTTEPRTFDSGFSGKVNLSTLSFIVHLRTYLLPSVYPITYFRVSPLCTTKLDNGHTVNVDNNATDRLLSIQFGQRRQLLANHLRVFRKEGPILEDHN